MSFTRVRAFFLVGFLAVAALVVVIVAVIRDTQGAAVAGADCPAGAPVASLRVPNGPQHVTVKIFNGTATQGLAEGVSGDFANRRFQVQKPAENKKRFDGVAVLRFGPEAVGAAQLVQAYFLNKAEPVYDAERKGAVVDVVIGKGYQQLGTLTEVNQSIGYLGEPTPPPGSCRAAT
ncbi:LytR C-terminal domain-containing protein [Actinoplanes sp. NPDC051859]|uniref:LytR C-terminal domain-containing protein n=1 Tax=Actinoplanes sp. NPDC051859 TaxID=3363909 RepID=UPI0037AB6561